MDNHPWLPNISRIKDMLREIGIDDVEQLFQDVPRDLILQRELKVGYDSPLPEEDIRWRLNQVAERNLKLRYPPFLGAGAYPHSIPSVIRFILSRSEFYTAYTPYQPEVNQGLLQGLFEYQSLMAELLEMDVVNSSHYDWGGSLAEAVLMGYRINGKRKVVIPESINPLHEEVLRTWISGRELEVVKIPVGKDGKIDLDFLSSLNSDEISSIYIQQPNFFGVVETELEYITDWARKNNVVSIMGVSPLSLGLIKTPGELGFDIAVGDGQELGIPLNFGGPYSGILATRMDMKLVRQMPGRIVGMTQDSQGRRGFTLILQTREQFARREKATSNITTNEALIALANAVYLSLLGKEGIRELATEIYKRSHYALKRMEDEELGKRKWESDFFEEFTFMFRSDYDRIHSELLRRGIHGGLRLGPREALFCVTEVHTKRAIDDLVNAMKEVA
ncbi:MULTISPECIES: aminomethyl-transferring glycine dehydrogenase subunit GcvPA [Metallosphaera]|uniref:aminomethyl-transferring glycine dehydrogenase subunit GcvPA n=1 Tax=Metallosphaera TaxID=41980 RepID=UPI001F06881C|nr:aminomethyl-transferring glycine dehydrogenase subunit GcvPA [Metallosphaera sedula]MCH1771278.1 aminomethyl-transferring glycine dehydrogenase subunit GcvPA [Metallosphaera sedula]MCP6729668.1 aminomethyl-transferring glycine dehydrogenase subunit GcvPA [Metallosphaera sedula]